MNLYVVLSFFITLIGVKRVLSSKVPCTDDSDWAPCHGHYDINVRQESRLKYEAINRPNDLQERSTLSTLLEDADRKSREWDTSLSIFKEKGPIGKNTEDGPLNGVANDNDPSDSYDESEGLQWTKSFSSEQELIQSLEADESGVENINGNTQPNGEDFQSHNLAKKLERLFLLNEFDVIDCKEAYQRAKALLFEKENHDDQPEILKYKTELLENLAQLFVEHDEELPACAKSLRDMKEILLRDSNEDIRRNGESRVTHQETEGPEGTWDNNMSDVQKITSKLATPEARQLNNESDIVHLKYEDESMLELTSKDENNTALKQIDSGLKRHLHRRSKADSTKSTPIDIKMLFNGGDVGSVEITRLAEGGGMALTSAGTLSTASPDPSSSIMNVTLDEEKQFSTHSVEGGGTPQNEAHTSSTFRLATDITDSTIPQEHNSQMGSDKEPSNTTNSDTKYHKTVPRKGAEAGKIVGRKGVNDLNIDDGPSTLLSVNKSSSKDLYSLSSNASQLIGGKGEVIESNPPLKKKPHPKPLTLTDKTSFNTTTVPHDHVSSQRDYVVPIVILIFAVPIVSILGTLLYKKGSEYWSRRHYRRMDFLIDGMYHD